MSSTCSGYTSPNGLEFQVHCDQEFSGSVTTNAQASADSVEECMGICSTTRPRCYAISYDASTKECSALNASTSLNGDRTNKDGVTVAIAQASQLLTPTDLICPYANSTMHTTQNGEQFSILCGVDFASYGDYCPYSLGDYNDFDCPPHTDSLSQCMDICSTVHPWCSGVTWNPDMVDGYANCYLKNDLTGGSPVSSTGDVMAHSAKVTARSIADLSVACPKNYTSKNGQVYDMHCFENRVATQNITSIHEQSVQHCIEACSSYTEESCLGVVFDLGMTDGYDNCYLLNSTGSPNGGANTTFAQREDRSSGINSSQGSQSGGSSKAWIAGPVIGAIALLAALLLAFFFWRRRSRRAPSKEIALSKSYPELHPDHLQEKDGRERPRELPDIRRHELRDQISEATVQHELES